MNLGLLIRCSQPYACNLKYAVEIVHYVSFSGVLKKGGMGQALWYKVCKIHYQWLITAHVRANY